MQRWGFPPVNYSILQFSPRCWLVEGSAPCIISCRVSVPTLFFFVLSVIQLLQHYNLLSIISDLYQLVLCSYVLKFNQVWFCWAALFHYCTMPILSEIRIFHSIIVQFLNKIRKWKNWFCNLFERHFRIECNTKLEPQQVLSLQSAKELEDNPQFKA